MKTDLIQDARTRKLLEEGESLANWSSDCIERSLALIRRTEALLKEARRRRAQSLSGVACPNLPG